MHSDCRSAVLGTSAAERLAATLDRSVTALESLLIAMDRGEFQDVKCLAKTLINDLGLEGFMLREPLRFQRWHATNRGSTDLRTFDPDGPPISQTPHLHKEDSLKCEPEDSVAQQAGVPVLRSMPTL